MSEPTRKSLIEQYFELSINLRREFIQKHKEEVAELIRFVISLMGTLGIIAGFGFTAFKYVNIPTLFFFGEILVIGVIVYLGFRTKTTLVSYAVDTEGFVNFWMKKATEIRAALLKKDPPEVQRLENELSKNMEDIEPTAELIGAKLVGVYLHNALLIAAAGIFIILLSFFK